MDDAAFTKFYEETFERLWAYIFRMVRSRALCDDIVQESYLRFLQSPPRAEEDAAKRSFLYTVATNLVRDSARRKSREVETDNWEELSNMIDGNNANFENNIDVARAFDRLPVQSRQLLWLSYVEGYDHAKIADILRLRKSSIKVLMFRARTLFINVWRSMSNFEKPNQ